MKKTQREYENKEYVEYLKESFYLITNGDDFKETISKIIKKLKGVNLDIFNSVIFYSTLIRIVEIKYKDALRNNDRDFKKINETRELKEEYESIFDDYLESIDKLVFLGAISEITYWIARIEGARQIKMRRDLLSSWMQEHKSLEKKNKYKRKGQQTKEKYKIILGNRANDYGSISKEHAKDIERFKTGRSDVFVNIDQEIDVKNSIYNETLLLPERWLGINEDFRVIDEHTKCVLIDKKEFSLREYYEVVKDEIDEKWLRDKDLLKQIITIYLIKRFQNGDEYAFNKLFDLYKDKASMVELHYMKSRGSHVDATEVKGRVLMILSCLLKGDDPSYLYKSLDLNQSEKRDADTLNKKPYLALNESYESMFSVVYSQFNNLIKVVDDLETNTKDFRNRSKIAKKTQTKKEYFENIFRYSQNVLSKVNSAPTLFSLFNPLDMLKISPLYNKYLFKPAPNLNLTTWLFGNKKNTAKKYYPGMLRWSLSNLFDGRISHKEDSFYEDEYAQDESGIYIKKPKKQEDL